MLVMIAAKSTEEDEKALLAGGSGSNCRIVEESDDYRSIFQLSKVCTKE